MGTSSVRFTIFDHLGHVVTSHQIEIESIFPNPGWVEQDPMVIWKTVKECMNAAADKLKDKGFSPSDVKAIGVTNQRETTIVWDKLTGLPLFNAVVWLDTRTASTVDRLVYNTPNNDKSALQKQCGLPISTYFSAVKLRWLLDNVTAVREEAHAGRCLFGTVDSWLIYNLTGGAHGGVHVTDVTNASRTMLMNIHTLKWDPDLLNFFGVPPSLLPAIRSSSEIYGHVSEGPFAGVPISGCLGDQQSALVGQLCLNKGEAKNTYGTGCFLLYNTGTKPVLSKHGLLTTAAYKLGPDQPCFYALEGSVAIAGAAITWLKDCLGVINSVQDVDRLAREVESTHGVYFVPAFSGLLAPYWRHDARGVICGLSQYADKRHIIRATLEAICFQTREVLEAMNKDCKIPLKVLRVDGGLTNSALLMELQADLLGIVVRRPTNSETTSFGAALAAGLAKGVGVYQLAALEEAADAKEFVPHITVDDRDERYGQWRKAVQRSLDWVVEKPEETAAHPPDPESAANVRSRLLAASFSVLTICSVGYLLYRHYRH